MLGTRPVPEDPHGSGLRLARYIDGREERVDQVARFLTLANDLDVFVQEERASILANAHGWVNSAPVILMHPPTPVLVPVAVEVPASIIQSFHDRI